MNAPSHGHGRGGRLAAIALMLACAGAAAAQVTVEPPPARVAAGDLVSWRILGAPAAWSGPDVAASAQLVVIGPDHRATTRAAFAYREFALHAPPADPKAPVYDPVGEPELRVRHAARLPGPYDWTLLAPGGAVLAHGAFTAAPSQAKPGPVGIARGNRRLLAWADGRVVIPIGCNIAWADAPDRVASFDHYLGSLVAAGGNACRMWMSSWSGQVEGEVQDHWRLDQAWLLDQLLARARAHGVLVTLVLDNFYDLAHGGAFPYGATTAERRSTFINPALPPAYLRRLRYVLARWGADDAIMCWELFNELDMAQPAREPCVAWVRSAANALQDMDGDHRLRAVSWCGDDFDRLAQVEGLDLTQIHRYVLEFVDPKAQAAIASRDDLGMLVDPAEMATRLGKPFCFGELGYQGVDDANPGNDLDGEGLLLRHQAWGGLLVGGYGSGMNWWWDTYIDKRNLWSQYTGLARTVARMDWNDTQLAPCEPDPSADRVLVVGWTSPTQALVWPQPHRDTWYHHFHGRHPRQGLEAAVKLTLGGFRPDTAFDLTWIDMVSGDPIGPAKSVQTREDGQIVVWVVPPDLDRVVVIRAHAAP